MNRLISLLFLLLICVLAQADQPTIDSVSDPIRQAEHLHEEARTLDNGWVITGKLIEQAKAAIVDDKLINADELSKRALRTARASVTQSKRQEEAWRARIPSS